MVSSSGRIVVSAHPLYIKEMMVLTMRNFRIPIKGRPYEKIL